MSAKSVLFVCVSNAGKSVMAAGLMRHLAGGDVHVASAGTHAKTAVNDVAVQTLAEVGVDISDHRPTQLTDQMIADADRVVIVGTQADLKHHPDTLIQRWETDEPSLRGIEGIDRMRIIRDDIAARVNALAAELTTR
ncbi:low molecular weight phosphatase family protein [Mycobacterium sp. SMC-4]|uniref:arsenate-mycothiol transferase ArsC n=1 Tax=Mycobacterium sp. SMC-4 TaxID=2857059 RepID=UPI0021B32734|nr:low molecular weight phosphatase family protein [Mycobacterium sp. SMC-4]UXA17108.1 low molecular weight phosphatase family protein [Mycobacterium sp. SMC-4]